MKHVWIEVALNGPWGRGRQPLTPVSPDEIIADGLAAAAEGASIIHVHPYDAHTGEQCHDWRIYARIIEGIRAGCDALVYPTITSAGTDGDHSPAGRYRHFAELARRGLIEIGAVDPGSVNFFRRDALSTTALGSVYQNPPLHVLEGLRVCAEHKLRPGYAIYEPGFTRLGAAFAAQVAGVLTPIYRFMFSDDYLWGFPPRVRYLEAHVALLEDVAPGAPWMVAGLGVDVLHLIPDVVAMGGHIRVGLEDAPWQSTLTNAEWVRRAAVAVRQAGGEPASPADVRAALAALQVR